METVEESRKTVADFMALEEGPPHAELINGVIVILPSALRIHQQVLLNLLFQIGKFVKADEAVGEIYMCPSAIYLDDHNVLCPDLSFFSAERLHLLSERGAKGVPDLAIEVLSPSTARRDRKVKREIYAQHGVKELWLVHPDAETIEGFDFARQLDEPVSVLENGTHPAITTAILPGLELPLAKVFRS